MACEFTAVVLAAGSGKRMHSDVPKQYMDLCGKPLICYALQAFEDSPVEEIVLVVSPRDEDYCRREIVEKYGFRKVHCIVPGGRERSESVLHGLQAASGQYVLIHDGARAFLSEDVILRMMDAVRKYKAAIAAVPEKNTIKTGDAAGFVTSTPDRSALWEVQTPQAFDRELILNAYDRLLQGKKEQREDFSRLTDDAMVVEQGGILPDGSHPRIRLVMGDYENIKVTTPEDLIFGEAILRHRK